VAVTTGRECTWSVTGLNGWLSLSSPSTMTGPGSASFTVAPNTGGGREATITVATHAYTVTQDAPAACTFSLDPGRREFDAHGGAASVSVGTTAGCVWTARSDVSWVAITGGGEGQGPGTVRYVVDENNGTAARTASLLVAGRVHTVEQGGEVEAPQCEYRVGPVEFSPCMARGSLSAVVTTGASCRWTATSDASWLSITSGRSGTGAGTITFTYADNYLAPRHGVVMVRWPTPSLGQNLHVEQAGCSYGVSRSSIDVASAGGTLTFDVVQESDPMQCGGPLQDGCVWTAKSDASWLQVTTSMPRKGDDRVTCTAAANTGATRTAHVTVGDRTVAVTQAGP
jgi:hypothetical protein